MNKDTTYHVIISFLSGAAGSLVVVVIAFTLLSNTLRLPMPGQIMPLFQTIANNEQPTETKQLPSTDSPVTLAVKKANPAVVSIVISKDVPIVERYYDNSVPPGDFFGMPFNFQVPQYRQNGTQRQEVGGGSGFLVSKDGLIVTNRHVVDQADASYTVFTNDGKKHDATVVARDPVNDLAVLRIEGSDFPFLTFGDSDNIQIGQSVIAIGNALAEFRNTVSVGVISGLARSITAGDRTGQSEQLENVIQTDAAINPGNSGGPLLDFNGVVIGVNVAVAQGGQNIGFALPGKLAKSVVESVQKTGKIVRPYLGVRYVAIDAEVKKANSLTVDYGVLVVRGESRTELAVIPGSPADKAGIVENDIILEVDGQKLDSEHGLATLVRQKNVGDTLKLKVLHKGENKDISVKLEAMPE